MPKPPSWLPYLGPVLAGLTAGLAGPHVPSLFLLVLLAAAVGFVPIVGYHLWKRAWYR